nr:hypothetical protein [Moorena sp. SIO3I6]
MTRFCDLDLEERLGVSQNQHKRMCIKVAEPTTGTSTVIRLLHPFFPTSCMLVGTYHCSIYIMDLPIEFSIKIGSSLEIFAQFACPTQLFATDKTVRCAFRWRIKFATGRTCCHSLPLSITFWQVSPRRSSSEYPKNAVDHLSVGTKLP